MANAVKLLNYVQQYNNYLTFFTDIESDLKIGDKVYIIGGNYDNTFYTINKNYSNKYALGYEVINKDISGESNGITLNIEHNNEFLDVYFSDSYLLDNPNKIREAYISKIYIKNGELNSGIINDGILGNYNIKGLPNDKKYIYDNDRTDYSIYESPSIDNTFTIGKNPYLETPIMKGGIFLGGEIENITTDTKYNTNKETILQSLNDDNSINSFSDPSKYNITKYTNNNQTFGYSKFISGNIGRIYTGNHYLEIVNNTILFDYLPYILNIKNDSEFHIVINSEKNNKVYDIINIDKDNKLLTISNNKEYSDDIIPFYEMFDENGDFNIEIYSKDININTGTFYNMKIFSGIYSNINILGGDVYWGEFLSGRLKSTYRNVNFNNGIINGENNKLFAEDIKWNNGYWKGGNWRGTHNISIENIIFDDKLTIIIKSKYRHLFAVGDNLLLSYIKDSNTNLYLQNYSDVLDYENINFNNFIITEIDNTDYLNTGQVSIILDRGIEKIENFSLVNARCSNSYFRKGKFEYGIWASGEYLSDSNIVNSITFIDNNHLSIIVDNHNVKFGDIIRISNLYAIHDLNIDTLETTSIDDYSEIYKEPFGYDLYVENIEDNILTLRFETYNFSINNNLYDSNIVGFVSDNQMKLYKAIWYDGQFLSGVINDGLFDNVLFDSKLYFDENQSANQITINKSYIKNGIFNKTNITGSVIENGILNDNLVTNNPESTILINGTINSGIWKRGEIKDAIINGGTIINGSINSIDEKSIYSNSFDTYKKILTNRSGNFINNTYSNLTAPSIIAIESDGTVQLDQPSYYQKGYNIIIQDLNSFENPFNNQMFTVREVNDDTTRIKIDYIQGSNPLYLLDEFSNNRPLIAMNNIYDYFITDKTYITDKNRIFVIDNKELSYLDYSDIIKIVITDNIYLASNNNIYVLNLNHELLKTYIVENLKTISVVDNAIFYSSDSIHYIKNDIDNSLNITGDFKAFFNDSVILVVNNENLTRYILDYNISSNTYSVSDTLNTNIVCDYFDFNNENIWYVKDNNIYKYDFLTQTNILLNNNLLDYQISNIRLNNNVLEFLMNQNGFNIIIAQGDINKIYKGIGNIAYKLLHQTDINKYFIYDDISNRIVYVDENNGGYANDDIINLDTNETCKTIIHGESPEIIYYITAKSGSYFIKKYNFILSTETIILTTPLVITDICITNNELFYSTNFVIVNFTTQKIYTLYNNVSILKIDANYRNGKYYVLYSTYNKVYEAVLSTTVESNTLLYNETVKDLCLIEKPSILNERYAYAYFVTNNGIVKTESDRLLNGKNIWSGFGNIIANEYNITSIDKISYSLQASYEYGFIKFDSEYITKNNSIDSFSIIDDTIYAVSNNRIVYYESTTSVDYLGRYKEISRINIENMQDDDYIYKNPNSIIAANDKIYFIDNSSLRIYDTLSSTYTLINSDINNDVTNVKDIVYNRYDNNVYLINNNYLSVVNNDDIDNVQYLPELYTKLSVSYDGTSNVYTFLNTDGVYVFSDNLFFEKIIDGVFEDIVFIDETVYCLKDNKIFYTKYNDTQYLRMLDINDVSYITETTDLNILSILSNNKIYSVNEGDIKDLDIRAVVTDLNDTYVYNNTIGIFKVAYPYQENIILDYDTLLTNITESNFIKMFISSTDNIISVFEDGAYYYNFNNNTVTKIESPNVQYRDETEQYPIDLSIYETEIVDASIYENNNILILYKIKNTNYYNIIGYSLLNKTYFYDDTILSVYNNGEAINIDNTIADRIYDNSGYGGIKYLFESTNGYIDYSNNNIFIYFQDDILMINRPNYEIITNNEYNDIILKTEINITDTVVDVLFYNESTSYSGMLSTSGISIGSETLLLNDNEYFIIIENDNIIVDDNYNLVIKNNLSINSTSMNYISAFVNDNIIDVKTGYNIFTIKDEGHFYTEKISNGTWIIYDSNDNEYNTILSKTDYILENYKELVIVAENFNYNLINQSVLENLSDNYEYTIVNKIYSSMIDNVSSFASSKIVYDSIIYNSSEFNKNGSVFSAHLIGSKFSGIFNGTWDICNFRDNYPLTNYSVFYGGTFYGDFHDGFFIGGDFNEKSNLYSGHIISNNDINFKGNILSDTRYDILEAYYENNKLVMKIQAIKNDNIAQITKLKQGTLIKCSLLKDFEHLVIDYINDKNNNIIVRINIPENIDNVSFNDLISKKIFINDTDNIDLFGYHYPIKSFVYDNICYIILDKKYNNQKAKNAKVSLNKFSIIEDITYGIEYSTVKIDMYIPSTAYANDFIRKVYLKENNDIINNNIIFDYYSQIFTTSFEAIKPLKLETKTLNYVHLSNINENNKSYVKTDYASNIVCYNSDIKGYDTNSILENNIFISGYTNMKWESGIWLNLDENGFSNGYSKIDNDFNGKYQKILRYDIDNDYIWISLENVLTDIKKYSYVNLRGFTGKYSKLIGTTRSKVFRIEDIDSNNIKIRNPFKYFNDFNVDTLLLQEQTMKLLKVNNNDVRLGKPKNVNFKDSQFDAGYLSDNILEDGFWANIDLSNTTNKWVAYNGYVKSDGGSEYTSVLSQSFIFNKNYEYKLKIDCLSATKKFYTESETTLNLNIYLNLDKDNMRIIPVTISKGINEYTFTTTEEYSTISFIAYYVRSGNIPGFLGTVILDSIDIELLTINNISDIKFDYAYLSNSSFDGGYLNGDCNTIFNAGYMNGNFSGEWFGHKEHYGYEGFAEIYSDDYMYIILDSLYFENGEYVYAKIDELDISFYGYVENMKLKFITNKFINGNYKVSITKYRLANNQLNLHYNSNLYTNATLTEQKTIFEYNITDNTNYVLKFDNNYSIKTDNDILKALNSGDTNCFSIDFLIKTLEQNCTIFSYRNSENNNIFRMLIKNSALYLEYTSLSGNVELSLNHNIGSNWSHIGLFYNNDTLIFKSGNIIRTFNVNMIFDNYNICSIGSYMDDYFKGYIDEYRIWNKDLSANFPALEYTKILNKYIPELTAYYSFDNSIDTSNIYPNIPFYVFSYPTDTYTLLEKDDIYKYSDKNIILEVKYYLETTTDKAKILTIEEIVDVSDNDKTYLMKYHLEILTIPTSNNRYQIELRETVSYDDINTTDELIETVSTIFETNIEYYKYSKLFINGDSLYVDNMLIGKYNFKNRNIFKYTINSSIILGRYDFINIYNSFEHINAIKGCIEYVNLWEDKREDNSYIIYRIKSIENTDNFDNNTNIASGDKSFLNIPYFENGNIIYDHKIYSSENDYTNSVEINNLDYSNSFPTPEWLSGDDFIQLNTSNLPANSSDYGKNNKYFLTYNSPITVSNMSDFKLYDNNIADIDGNAKMHITANGYIFFDRIDNKRSDMIIYTLPIIRYTDLKNDPFYNRTYSTPAIMLNTMIDVRASKGGFVKYADREDEIVIQFCGYSTDMERTFDSTETDRTNYNNYIYSYKDVPVESLKSFFAIRIDKKTSKVLFYIRRLGESNDQKYLGIRRSDGYISTIKDTSFPYYKIPKTDYVDNTLYNRPLYNGDSDFVVGYKNNNVLYANNTEYILYIPRFINTDISSIVDSIYNDNYFIDDIEIIKTFKGLSYNNYSYEQIDFNFNKVYYNGDINNMIVYNPNDYIVPTYKYSSQYDLESLENIPQISFFDNGNFKSLIWREGTMRGGIIENDKFIWKYGIKNNSILKGGDDVDNYACWLGGYNIGDNNNSVLENVIWYRGKHQGGKWLKGHWFSLDKDLNYTSNDYSIWNKGVWYSLNNKDKYISTKQLFTYGDNGKFESDESEWGMTVVDDRFQYERYHPAQNAYSLRISNNNYFNIDNISYDFDNRITVLETGYINVMENTEYTIIGEHDISIPAYYSDEYNSIFIEAVGDNEIINIEQTFKTFDKNYLYVNNELKSSDKDRNRFSNIKHHFNSGNNKQIKIAFKAFGFFNFRDVAIKHSFDNISMNGKYIDPVYLDYNNISNHDSVWHGGKVVSENVIKSISENNIKTYQKYSYLSDTYADFYVANNNKIQLPLVNSIFLGGMWLRGEFDGGIMANMYWHSLNTISVDNDSVNDYENLVYYKYDESYSLFKRGKMINSIWNGGIARSDNFDHQEIIMGDLINKKINYIDKNNNYDFKWDTDFIFYDSTNEDLYDEILGRKYFNKYHYSIIMQDTEANRNDIEDYRINKQYNSDGLMSVYWKRGKFYNGIFQFSVFDSLNLDNNKQTVISENVNDNYSHFTGIFYTSRFVNGLYYALADNTTKILSETKNIQSLFYKSIWEKGYWKAVGLESDASDDIEITNALFLRSLWKSGVFEGGVFDLSVWLSGVDENITMKYKNSQTVLSKSTNSIVYSLGYRTDNNYDDYVFGDLSNIDNDSSFITYFENSNYRYLGDIDNLASIWVNGLFRGSVWHGGIFQRGYFRHKDLSETQKDFFNVPSQLGNYQISIWNRGLFLSGYFSYYNDKYIKQGVNLSINAHMYNDPYKLDINTNNKGRRCLFMSINSNIVNDNTSIMGMSSDSYLDFVNDSKIKINKHNYASVYSRKMVKTSTNKPYFNMFSGAFINGIIYQDETTNFNNSEKIIISLFSSISEYYVSLSNINNVTYSTINYNFFENIIKLSDSNRTHEISYNLSPIVYNTITTDWEFAVTPTDQSYLDIVNNTYLSIVTTYNLWRFNTEEYNMTDNFGDGTDTSLLPEYIDINDKPIKPSIAQGCGMKYHKNEASGEPKYDGTIGYIESENL